MIATIAPRILNLPADVRAALARVDGPGWILYGGPGEASRRNPDPRLNIEVGTPARMAFIHYRCKVFWPANPAASVAAVLYPPGSPLHLRGLYHAHELLRVRLVDGGDDHAAALSIIEAHVADDGAITFPEIPDVLES